MQSSYDIVVSIIIFTYSMTFLIIFLILYHYHQYYNYRIIKGVRVIISVLITLGVDEQCHVMNILI